MLKSAKTIQENRRNLFHWRCSLF